MSQVLTLAQLQDLFYGVTVTSTGIDGKFVRHAYQSNSQPAWELAQNVIFINLTLVDSPYDKQRDVTYQGNDATSVEQVITYPEVLQVMWTLYGPNSFDLARTLKNALLTAPIRETLKGSYVYPLTDMPNPTKGPTEFNMQWWERSDLKALFNVGNQRTAIIPTFASANILIETDIPGEAQPVRTISVT